MHKFHNHKYWEKQTLYRFSIDLKNNMVGAGVRQDIPDFSKFADLLNVDSELMFIRAECFSDARVLAIKNLNLYLSTREAVASKDVCEDKSVGESMLLDTGSV